MYTERFLAKIQKTDNCWEWLAGKESWGYGEFWLNGKQTRAHRVSYELFVGPIPDGMLVCHTCDNPSCVNPEHLFLGTDQDNADDKVNKERSPRGSANGRSKIDELDAAVIRESDLPRKFLADWFGISVTQVGRVQRKEQWK